MAQKLDTIYYDIQGVTKHLDDAVARAEQKLTRFGAHGVRVPLEADGRALDTALQRAQGELSATDRAVQKLTNGFRGLTLAAAAYKAAEYAREAVALADTYASMEARLALVTHGTEELVSVQRELFDIAQDAQQPLTGVAELYTRVARSGKDLGASQSEIIKFSDGVANALRVSGTGAAQAEGSLLQLSQALGNGVVQAQEFNSILEGTPRIAQAVADGMGKTGISVSELRRQVLDGKVTSEAFFQAFLRGSENIKKEAATIPETVGGAITKLNNAVLQYVGVGNKASGTTLEIAHALNVLAENLDNVVQLGTALGVVFGGRFLAAGITSVAAVTAEQVKLKLASIESAQATARAAVVEAAYAEDALRSAAASKAVAEAEVLQAERRLQEVAATQAAIVAERELTAARLATMNASGSRAAGQLAQPGLPALGGAAVAREQEALAKAERARIAATRELASLGVAQSAQAQRELVELSAAGKARGQLASAIVVEKEALAAVGATSTAVALAEKEVAVATSLMSTTMKGAAVIARGFWAAIGGPIGAIVIGLYAVYAALKRVEAEALAKYDARQAAIREKTDAFAKSLAGMSLQALKAAEAQERLNTAQAATKAGELGQQIVKFKEFGADRNEATGGPAKLKKMMEEYTKAVDAAGESAGRVNAIVAAMDSVAGRSLSTVTDKADKAAEKFRDLADAAKEYGRSLAETEDPIGTAAAKIAVLKAELEKQIPLLKKGEQAAARLEQGTIIGQLDEDLGRLQASELSKLTEQLDKLTKKLSGDTIEAAGDAFAALAKEARSYANAASLAAQNANDGFDADSFREKAKALFASADAFDREGAAAVAAAKFEDAYSRAIHIKAQALEAVGEGYRGHVPKIEAVREATATLEAAEATLLARLEDTTLSLGEQQKAAEALRKVQAALRGEVGGSSNGPTTKPVEDTNLLSAALLAASNHAADLARNLGESGGKLGELAATGIKVANILKAVQAARQADAAQTAAGTSTASSRLANKSDWIALVVGGVIELAGALDLFGGKARKRAQELRDAALAFNRALDDFAIVQRSDLQTQLRNNLKGASNIVTQKYKDVGSSAVADFKSSDDILALIKELQSASSLLPSFLNLGPQFQGFADELQRLYLITAANEQELTRLNDKKNADAEDDVRVRALVAQGRTEEAEALRVSLQLQREIDAAQLDTSDSGKAYVAHLKQVQEEEAAAAAVARNRSSAQRILDNEIKAFGLAGKAAFEAIFNSLTAQYPEIRKAVEGLDLSTQAGLDALKQRGQELLLQFEEGGISDAEQAIIDSFWRIYDTATDVFDSMAERIQRALGTLSDDNEILGGNATVRLGRRITKSTGFDTALDSLLANADFSTAAGAAAFQDKLKAFYIQLMDGGITDAEEPILSLVKGLFGDVTQVIEEGIADADAAIAASVASRQARQNRASRLTAVTDVEGVDAYINFLNGLSPALSNMFGAFSVANLDGITEAKNRLVQLNATVDRLSDEEILAKFGVTRDELIDSILKLDSSLDGLAGSAKSAAEAALELANSQQEFTASVKDDFLRASGNDQQADIDASLARTQAKLERAKALGVSQSIIDQITATGALDLSAIKARYAEKAANAATPAATPSSGTESPSVEFTASAVKSITTVQAIRIDGILQSSFRVQSDILALLRNVWGGGLPALRVPALPAGIGGFSAAASGNGSIITININVAGNLSTKESARELGRTLAPIISQEMRRRAAGLTAITGGAI